MTTLQKTVLAVLTGIAVLIFVLLFGAAIFLLWRAPESQPAPVALAQQVQVPVEPSSTPLPPPSVTPTSPPPLLPTPTSTRVVGAPPLPTATPLPSNCLNNIVNFETSGLMTNEEVQQYLRQTIPTTHLDYCRLIEYQPRLVGAHATPIAGSFTPMFRQIYVYAINPEFLTREYLRDTLLHEIGHNVHYNLRRQSWDLGLRWTELHKLSKQNFARDGLGFVSDYARYSDFEDFAETYRAYVLEPELLRFASPEKYEFMRQEVFAGQEY